MLYKEILDKYPGLFTTQEAAQIEAILAKAVQLTGVSDTAKVGDNKYLVGIVMAPFILNESDALRIATQNMLVFCEEANNSESAFARVIVNERTEQPFDRLKWFYKDLSRMHPIYPLLLAGENGTRRRKGLPVVNDASEPIWDAGYSIAQLEAINDITNAENPKPDWWWND